MKFLEISQRWQCTLSYCPKQHKTWPKQKNAEKHATKAAHQAYKRMQQDRHIRMQSDEKIKIRTQNDGNFECLKCQDQNMNLSQLIKHVKTKNHTGEPRKPKTCAFCERNCANRLQCPVARSQIQFLQTTQDMANLIEAIAASLCATGSSDSDDPPTVTKNATEHPALELERVLGVSLPWQEEESQSFEWDEKILDLCTNLYGAKCNTLRRFTLDEPSLHTKVFELRSDFDQFRLSPHKRHLFLQGILEPADKPWDWPNSIFQRISHIVDKIAEKEKDFCDKKLQKQLVHLSPKFSQPRIKAALAHGAKIYQYYNECETGEDEEKFSQFEDKLTLAKALRVEPNPHVRPGVFQAQQTNRRERRTFGCSALAPAHVDLCVREGQIRELVFRLGTREARDQYRQQLQALYDKVADGHPNLPQFLQELKICLSRDSRELSEPCWKCDKYIYYQVFDSSTTIVERYLLSTKEKINGGARDPKKQRATEEKTAKATAEKAFQDSKTQMLDKIDNFRTKGLYVYEHTFHHDYGKARDALVSADPAKHECSLCGVIVPCTCKADAAGMPLLRRADENRLQDQCLHCFQWRIRGEVQKRRKATEPEPESEPAAPRQPGESIVF